MAKSFLLAATLHIVSCAASAPSMPSAAKIPGITETNEACTAEIFSFWDCSRHCRNIQDPELVAVIDLCEKEHPDNIDQHALCVANKYSPKDQAPKVDEEEIWNRCLGLRCGAQKKVLDACFERYPQQ